MKARRTTPVKLFATLPSKGYGRLIVRYPYQDDTNYAFAYREAARRLASTFRGDAPDDLILLPFLTLYRQAFELQVKEFIHFLAGLRRQYEGQSADTDRAVLEKRLQKDLGHNLHKLLNEARKHYDALALDQPFPKSIENLLLMLHEADATGTAFRYAGEFPDTQDHIDFPHLVKLLDDEWELLDGVWAWIDDMHQAIPTLDELM